MPDDLNQLKKAREALIRERRNRAATIVSTSGSIGDAALDALIKVQEAIEVD
jgi:predicted metal-dependent peptidase